MADNITFATNQNKITAAFVTEFAANFEIQTQQKVSRLLATAVNKGKITGNSFTINDLGSLEMQDRTRFGDTAWNLPDAGVRHVYMGDKSLAVPIDRMDIPKMIASVQGPYTDACLSAYNRQVDAIIYAALLGNISRIDEYNGTAETVSLPATQKILHGGTAITKSKIIAAKALFRKNECDEENGEKINMIYNSAMLTTILGDTTLTSADFMAIKMLQEGAVGTKWLGVNWIPYEKLLTLTDGANTVYRTAMYTSTAVHYGQGSAYTVDIGVRRDKNNAIQIYVDASMGAGRANEDKVVELQFI